MSRPPGSSPSPPRTGASIASRHQPAVQLCARSLTDNGPAASTTQPSTGNHIPSARCATGAARLTGLFRTRAVAAGAPGPAALDWIERRGLAGREALTQKEGAPQDRLLFQSGVSIFSAPAWAWKGVIGFRTVESSRRSRREVRGCGYYRPAPLQWLPEIQHRDGDQLLLPSIWSISVLKVAWLWSCG